MKSFTKECKENHYIKVIENGYLVSGGNLGDNQEYYCRDITELFNYLARRLNVIFVGERIEILEVE
jgi:hypothetical protein